jgi:hypothetical protein
MNLEGLISLAQLADHVGVDLWNFQTEGRGDIRKAVLFLAPFAHDPKKWPYKQISTLNPAKLGEIARRARKKYKDAEFQRQAVSINTQKES